MHLQTRGLQMEFTLVFFVVFLLTGVCCQSQWHDPQEYYDPLAEEKDLPVILSEGKTFDVVLGGMAKLPCDVDNLGEYSITWKLDKSKILFVIKGTAKGIAVQKVIKDQRVKLKGTNLIINDVKVEDGNVYNCQVELGNEQFKPRVIHHVINVKVPPSIWPVNNSTYIKVDAGKTVTLDCQTDGKPKPRVSWARKDFERMRGRQEGSAFVITEVDRFDAGEYKCSADNGVPPGASADITLVVKHKPEVEVPSPVKHIGVGYGVSLMCFVYAASKVKVEWFRNGTPVNPLQLRQSVNKQLNRHSLIFNSVKEEDFGMYTCNASDFYGTGSAQIELTGRPNNIIINSESESDYPDLFTLVWTVESYSPILSYIISYKNESEPDDMMIELTVPGSSSSSFSSFVHSQSHNITHLTPNSGYSVIIRAKNEFGYSTLSEPFNFTTADMEYIPDDYPFYDTTIPESEQSSIEPEIEEPTMTIKTHETQGSVEKDPEDATSNVSSQLVSNPDDEEIIESPSTSNRPFTGQRKPHAENKLGISASSPVMSAADKRAQTVAMVTAISLSAFFL